jgi:hypothetical protein
MWQTAEKAQTVDLTSGREFVQVAVQQGLQGFRYQCAVAGPKAATVYLRFLPACLGLRASLLVLEVSQRGV